MTDFNDSLDDLLGTPATPRQMPQDEASVRIREQVPVFTETCPACRGTGQFRSWSGRLVGKCFKCKGVGSKTFKTSTEHRAKAKDDRQRREAKFRMENVETFKQSHPDMLEWMQRKATSFDFAANMLQAVIKYGDLTEKQQEAVHRCMAREVEFSARKAEQSKTFSEKLNSPILNVDKLQLAFNAAHAAGLKKICMRVDGFMFLRAPDHGKNPGAIYVKFGDLYLGKIVSGVFSASRDCTKELEAKLVLIAEDPLAAAKAHGIRTGSCSCCGRELTDPASVAAGIGPICARRFGF